LDVLFFLLCGANCHDPDGIVASLELTGLDNAFEKTTEFLE
jgi:hypothetical protein